MKNNNCRVCDGPTTSLFTKVQLKKYEVHYFRCLQCGGAQTETPFWLEEAYNGFSFAQDTGMVARTLMTSQLSLALAYSFKFSRETFCLDLGGGTGLLTRRLRDCGLNAFWNDKYAKNIFAIGFEDDFSSCHKPVLLTAFEVFEHLAHPQEEIGFFLKKQPDFLLFSTKLYCGQDKNWWYFLEDGQHVQFYSAQGLHLLASRHDYHFCTDGNTFHLFSREKLPQNLFKRLFKLLPSIEKKAVERWGSRTEMDHVALRAASTKV